MRLTRCDGPNCNKEKPEENYNNALMMQDFRGEWPTIINIKRDQYNFCSMLCLSKYAELHKEEKI